MGLKYLWIVLLIVPVVGTHNLFSSQGQEAQQEDETQWVSMLPEGEGKELMVTQCTNCHTLEKIVTQRRTAEEWADTVYDMIGRGAMIFVEEADAIADYLGKSLGPEASSAAAGIAPAHSPQPNSPKLNLQTASAEELVEILKLDARLAREIVAYREEHGTFQTLKDLEKIPGVDTNLIERSATQVVLEQNP